MGRVSWQLGPPPSRYTDGSLKAATAGPFLPALGTRDAHSSSTDVWEGTAKGSICCVTELQHATPLVMAGRGSSSATTTWSINKKAALIKTSPLWPTTEKPVGLFQPQNSMIPLLIVVKLPTQGTNYGHNTTGLVSQKHHSVCSPQRASREATTLHGGQGETGTDDEVWVTVELTSVTARVIQSSYSKRNHVDFCFPNNKLLGSWIFFLSSTVFCHERPGKCWPCHGNYWTASELFCTQGRAVAGGPGALL